MLQSKNILTIGCKCNPPKGGVAYVLNSYMNYVYEPFNFVANSGGKNAFIKLWYMISALIKCEFKYIFNKEIDIVHIHTASNNSFKRSALFIKQAKRYGKKVVCHIHGGAFKTYRESNKEFVDKILQQSDAIVALSEYWKQFFTEEVGLNNVFVIKNIIPKPEQKKVIHEDKLHLLFLGFITEAKGIFDLIETINANKETWKDRVVLHIGGNGKVEKLKELIAKYGLENTVIYEGWVSGDKKAELLSQADGFILPSYTEGLPISILEAMSYGLPILSTPVGSIPEIIKDGENGFLFEPKDCKNMANCINMLLNDKSLVTLISGKNISVAQNYLPDAVEHELCKLYELI